MKMQNPLVKNKEFQDGDSGSINRVWSLSKHYTEVTSPQSQPCEQEGIEIYLAKRGMGTMSPLMKYKI